MRDVICNRVIMNCRHQEEAFSIMAYLSIGGLTLAGDRAVEPGF